MSAILAVSHSVVDHPLKLSSDGIMSTACSAHNVTTDLAILHVKSVTHDAKGSVTTYQVHVAVVFSRIQNNTWPLTNFQP